MTNVVSIADRMPASDTSSRPYVPTLTLPPSIDFEVYERDLFFTGKESRYHVPSHKALVRTVAGNPLSLAVVGTDYKVLQNRELFTAVHDEITTALKDTPNALDGMTLEAKTSYYGKTCIVDYRFPNMRVDIGSKSQVAFRTIVVNSFGGTSVKLYTGAIDFFCTNGMVFGNFDHLIKKHTKGLTIEGITERVSRAVDVFYKRADLFKDWYKKTIDSKSAMEIITKLPGISDRLADELHRQFLIEATSHGFTVWALYSALTYYATHDEGEFAVRKTSSDHSAATLLKREEQVHTWVNSEAWKEAA